MGVYLLWGDDDFRLEKALISLRKKILKEEISPLNHRMLINPETRVLLENLQTTGMMFGSLLIEIHSKNLFLRTSNAEKEDSNSKKETVSKILDSLEYLPANVSVVFVCQLEKSSNKKIDGASKMVKNLKKIGEVIEFASFKPWQTKEIIQWIVQNAKEKSLSIKPDAAEVLLVSTGEDLRKLDSEINKLELLAYPNKTITISMVKSLGLSCDNIFTFSDFWLIGDKQKTYQELEKLLEKDEPIRILAFLQSALRRWLNLKIDSKTMSQFEISKKLNMHEYRVKLELQKLSKISVEKLVEMQKKLTETEFKLKSGKLTPRLALELMI